MFTGIIEKTAHVKKVYAEHKGIRVRIEKPRGWKLVMGQSISIDGICSTVVAQTSGAFEVDYMPETMLKTTASSLKKDSTVNLERSLVYGARIEGHIVQGHVDTQVRISHITKQGSSSLLSFRIPAAFKRYVALHGSITMHGVSLTVARLSGTLCTVALIPHTLTHTNLGFLVTGDHVNIEVDYLARYGIAATATSGTVLRNATKGVQKNTRRRRRLEAQSGDRRVSIQHRHHGIDAQCVTRDTP